jgi:hypothetical protein
MDFGVSYADAYFLEDIFYKHNIDIDTILIPLCSINLKIT